MFNSRITRYAEVKTRCPRSPHRLQDVGRSVYLSILASWGVLISASLPLSVLSAADSKMKGSNMDQIK